LNNSNSLSSHSSQEEDLLKVRLCALLHDIGKPLCWGVRKSWSHHVEFGFEILEYTFGKDVAKTAVSHHTTDAYAQYFHPGNKLERTISVADHIASGADRHISEDPSYGGAIPSRPVVMTHVLVSANNKPLYTVMPDELISFTEDFKRTFKDSQISEKVYDRVYQYISNSVLKRIPADTRNPYNDVSLFDHLRFTSAIANCIWSQKYSNTDPSSYRFGVICADTDRVSSFISRSPRLPDLRAGSSILSNAVKEAANQMKQNIGPECIVFEGGGSFLAISDPKFASSIKSQVMKTFESLTLNDATISVDSIEVEGSEIQRNFADVWEMAIKKIYELKTQRQEKKPLLEEGKMVCDVCKLRPSSYEERRELLINTNPSFEYICHKCKTRREIGRGGKSIDEIVDDNKLVAVLKIDGDDIGEIINGEKITKIGKHATPSRLTTISRLVHQACGSELKRIVEDNGGEPIYIGGDDVLAILPGNRVFKAAIDMQDTFNRLLGGSEFASMSAGISIFNCKIPIYAGLESANECLKRAKNKEGKASISFDFLFGIPSNIAETRKVTPNPVAVTSTANGITISSIVEYDQRLYKWSDFKEMLHIVDHLKMVQQSPLRAASIHHLRRIVQKSKSKTSDKVEAELLIKYGMGKKVLNWDEGNYLLKCLNDETLTDAFIIYSILKEKRRELDEMERLR
jgi:putative nucleotidyltransferase with HDIG domain